MKPPVALPAVVLGVAATTVVLSIAFVGPTTFFLTSTRSRPLAYDLLNWWFVAVPLAVGSAAIVAIVAIAAVRSSRAGGSRDIVGILATGILGIAATGVGLWLPDHWRLLEHGPAVHAPIGIATSPVFLPEQWRNLTIVMRQRNGDATLQLRPDGIGIDRAPGFIPFDPFLLKRVTFKGLGSKQVTDLLGPPMQPPRLPDPGWAPYAMIGGPVLVRADLRLSYEPDDRGTPVVRAESLYIARPEY